MDPVTDLTRQLQELTARVELLTRQRDDARTAGASLQRELDAMRAELERGGLRMEAEALLADRDRWRAKAAERTAPPTWRVGPSFNESPVLAEARAALDALQRECLELRADRLSAELEALRDPPDGMTRLALSVSSPRWRAAVIDAALAGELLSTVLGPLAPSLGVLHDGRVTVQIDFVPSTEPEGPVFTASAKVREGDALVQRPDGTVAPAQERDA